MLNGDVGTEKKDDMRTYTNFTNLYKSDSTTVPSGNKFTIKNHSSGVKRP